MKSISLEEKSPLKGCEGFHSIMKNWENLFKKSKVVNVKGETGHPTWNESMI